MPASEAPAIAPKPTIAPKPSTSELPSIAPKPTIAPKPSFVKPPVDLPPKPSTSDLPSLAPKPSIAPKPSLPSKPDLSLSVGEDDESLKQSTELSNASKDETSESEEDASVSDKSEEVTIEPTEPEKPEEKEPEKTPEQKAQEIAARRLKIIDEILSTESTYINALEAMISDYFNPMLDAAETEMLPGITKDDIRSIFSNVNHLLPISKTLYDSVEQRRKNWHDGQMIADIFLKMAPFFRIYNTYQNNYEKAGITLTRCQSNEMFNQMVDRIDKNVKQTKKDVVGLEGLLIQPVQRIPRYILLLDTLNGKTPENHPDKENAQEASKSLQRVMNYLDQDITSHEFRQKFLDFGAKIKGASSLIEAHRVLIAEATLNLKSKNVQQVGGGIKSKWGAVTKEGKLQIWLFNDVLVHLKTSKNKKKTNVSSTKYTWPLQLIWLKDNPDPDPIDTKMPHTFMLVGPCKTYTLRFAELSEKNNWYSKIKDTVDKMLTKEIAPDDIHRYGTYKFPDKYVSEYEGWWMSGRIHGNGTYKIFGNRYTGDWEYNRKCGVGTFQSVTGEVYHGEWKDDRPHGYGQLQYSNQDRYDGEWVDGLRHGKGIHNYNNGDKYIGEWINGVPSGSGTYCTVTGILYGGSWNNGKPHGYGCLVTPNGRRYEGEFKNGLKSGEGKLDFNNGNFYIGQWFQDRFHGFGIYHCAVEGVYEGMFVNGLKEGHGKMRYRNGDMYDGQWKRGLYHEKGVLVCATGGMERYDGTWDNGKQHGRGVLTYRNGSKYEGQFKEGKMHGTGTLTTATGVIFDGRWVDGRREGKASITVGPVNYASICTNGMMGKRESSFLVAPDVPYVFLDL